MKGTNVLPILFDQIEVQHKFYCLDTKVSQALIGYDFIRKHKIDILSSANCIVIQNVPIITHFHKYRKSVGFIISEKCSIAPSSEHILVCQPEESEVQLLSEEF